MQQEVKTPLSRTSLRLCEQIPTIGRMTIFFLDGTEGGLTFYRLSPISSWGPGGIVKNIDYPQSQGAAAADSG